MAISTGGEVAVATGVCYATCIRSVVEAVVLNAGRISVVCTRFSRRSARTYLSQATAIALLVTGAVAAQAQSGLVAGQFSLRVDTKDHLFTEMGGIQTGVEPQGTFSKTTTPTVTLKRAATGDTTIRNWGQLALAGHPSARKTVTLTIIATGKPAQRYLLTNALPKVASSSVGGTSYETLTLTCQSIAPAP